ncbi:MAG: type II secretion system F family protein [Candidatus Nomurabacteria bacterium]|nr:type II secretion system F family protein [Candidatus Nomurabacteria bacterium]
MKFKYTSQTKTGEIHNGIIDAVDKFAAAKQVHELGETPLFLKPIDEQTFLAKMSHLSFGSIKLREKIIFTRNLSGMLQAGLSLSRSLIILEKQSTNVTYKDILKSLSESISKGSSLSDGMKKFPNVFSTLFVAMIGAGEESGSLPKSLGEVGASLQKSYDLNKKIKGALMYPGVIFSAMILIGVLMLMFVVPTLTKTFKDVGASLPASTRFIIWLSDTVSHNIGLVVLFFAGIVAVFYFLGKIEKTKIMLDYIVLKLPVISNLIKETNSARTARTLSSLLSSGVNMSRALDITKDVLQNYQYKKTIEKAIFDLEKGLPLSSVFKEKIDLYPIMMGEMMEVGEETGNLAAMLVDIASFYEGEVDAKTKDLSTIIEPVLMIFIGAAVGFFAVSMLTPMYSVLENIK